MPDESPLTKSTKPPRRWLRAGLFLLSLGPMPLLGLAFGAQAREVEEEAPAPDDLDAADGDPSNRVAATPRDRGDRRQVPATARRPARDEVDEAGHGSFPASDPPAWTAGRPG